MFLPRYTMRNIRIISSFLIIKSGYLSSFNDFAMYELLQSGMSFRIMRPLLVVSTAYILPGIGFSSPFLYASSAILSPTLNVGYIASSRIICHMSIEVSKSMMRDSSKFSWLFWTYLRMSVSGCPAITVGSIGARFSSNIVGSCFSVLSDNISPVPVMSHVVFSSGKAS